MPPHFLSLQARSHFHATSCFAHNLPVLMNDTNCLSLFQPIHILAYTAASASPSTLSNHVDNETYPLTPLHWPNINTSVTLTCTSYRVQAASTNEWLATFDMLPFIPLHLLCTHLWPLVHWHESLPSPLQQNPLGHFTAFCLTFWHSTLIITTTTTTTTV